MGSIHSIDRGMQARFVSINFCYCDYDNVLELKKYTDSKMSMMQVFVLWKTHLSGVARKISRGGGKTFQGGGKNFEI